MRESRDTAKGTQPLYSSGAFFERASMRETAAVTTPMCWSLSKWIIRDVHSPVREWGVLRETIGGMCKANNTKIKLST